MQQAKQPFWLSHAGALGPDKEGPRSFAHSDRDLL
jgi:hypothetical protein